MSEVAAMPAPILQHDLSAKEIAALLAAQPRTVHLVGIGGCGVSGLAKLLLAHGHRVSGSDLESCGEVQRLRHRGVVIRQGHRAEHLGSPDLVAFTSAAAQDNPELLAAREARIPAVRRARLLAALMIGYRRTFAIAGIHGKTTTSAMLAHILRRAELSPTFCIGAHVPILGENAAKGSGEFFVLEADESDGTLEEYVPTDAIVLNIEPEHMDHFETLEALSSSFSRFAHQARQVYYNVDDPITARLCSELPGAISFGLTTAAEYRATHICQEGFSVSFDLLEHGANLGRVKLHIPGAQNALNATAAAAAARAAGASFEQISAALAEFTGASRRFERKLHNEDFIVLDDYAHHPTEIRATLEAVRGLKRRRIVAVFQPHRYTRTQLLREQFATAFVAADRLFLTDVYAANEPPLEGVSGETILKAVEASGQRGVSYESSLDRLAARVAAEAQRGDVIAVLGAGDITKVADELAARLRPHPLPRWDATRDDEEKCFGDLCEILSNRAVIIRNEPLSRHTTLKVGGAAQFWVEPDNERDLWRLLQYCRGNRVPFYFIGRGSNLLVRDGGVPGVVIRLNHPDFCKIEIAGEQIRAGAGVSLRQLVMTSKRASLTGLEFLEGIPGSLGGALRMNAGAMGASTFDVVETVRLMDFEGRILDLPATELKPSYRCCEMLRQHVALAATLRARKGAKPDIERQLAEFERKRWASQPAAPSAGCIFKNPSSIPAGRLIDELGLKGLAVGGARISEIHGNFIVNEGGATAADLLRLIEKIRDTARRKRGVELEPEVEIWGNP